MKEKILWIYQTFEVHCITTIFARMPDGFIHVKYSDLCFWNIRCFLHLTKTPTHYFSVFSGKPIYPKASSFIDHYSVLITSANLDIYNAILTRDAPVCHMGLFSVFFLFIMKYLVCMLVKHGCVTLIKNKKSSSCIWSVWADMQNSVIGIFLSDDFLFLILEIYSWVFTSLI